MLVIRDPSSTQKIGDSEMAALADQRFAMLSEEEPYDPKVHGFFIVLEPGDAPTMADEPLGFALMSNRFDGTRFGESDFTPSFEFVEEHSGCFEMVFVLSDDGYGIELFIPKGEGTDAELLAMCRRYAVHHKEATNDEN